MPNPSDPAPAGDTTATQSQFGHYRIIKDLGRGAQGVVKLAEDVNLHRQVALKMLTEVGARSSEARERFQREANLASRLDHPGICGIYEVGEVEGLPFIAMQYVRGTTLATILDEAKKTPEGSGPSPTVTVVDSNASVGAKVGLQDFVRLIERAGIALHAAHEAGLIHRDIKPGNIMVTREGDPVLLDFGLARDEGLDHTLTQSGQIMGTPAYLAPEQILAERGGVDRRADVYALGVTLFECLTLRRPYEAQAVDQLFQQILSGNLTNPRKLNPRIPNDLRTVIEVAMERDRDRRYPTALAFAEDLRRVRAFEPIAARAAGPWARLRKWSRRHPGQAASWAGVVVAVAVAASAFLLLETSRRAAVADNLAAAERHLAAGEFDQAQEAIARAVEREPESLRASELRQLVETARDEAQRVARRSEAMTGAAAARTEAATCQQRHAEVVEQVGALRLELLQARPRGNTYAPEATHAEFAQREARLRELEVAAETELAAAQQALERAARLESPWQVSPETEAALAAFYVGRWREADAAGDKARAASFRLAAERHDKASAHAEELAGHGSLAVTVSPADAELFLFRFEDAAAFAGAPTLPRLVPVPTTGMGDVREGEWCPGFRPGDPCLLITHVAAGSLAAAAGLATGDLVITIDGHPADGSAFLRLPPDHALREGGAGIVRVDALQGHKIESPFDWTCVAAQGAADHLRLRGSSREFTIVAAELTPVGAAQLAADQAVEAMRLRCLRAGEPVDVEVPPGTISGLRGEITASPLLLTPHNRFTAGTTLAAESGSYLVVARHAGCEQQSFPVHVPRNSHPRADILLLPAGTSPPGFAWVPPGTFHRGGDARAFQSLPAEDVAAAGFWIGRFEVDNEAYFAFLNDPAVRQEIEASGNTIRLPRDGQSKLLAKKNDDGAWSWAAFTSTSAQSPVLGVSWQDARAYVGWRNQDAERRGEPWGYDLPSTDEWEKAARGVDGRLFPWGNEFWAPLVVCGTRKAWPLLDAPGGMEPRDESVYGVRDLGGSREEWTRDAVPQSGTNQQQSVYYKLGGSWASTTDTIFRAASRPNAGETRAASAYGFRLVARRR